MKRRTLEQLVEQARRERDDAATRVAGAHRDAEGAQRTLDVLSNYLGEHLRGAGARPYADARLLQVRERFTRKLDAAIGEQAGVRDALHEAMARRRGELVERQRRLLAFETLQARRNAVLVRRLARAEQRQTDEIAARAFRRTAGGGSR